VLLFEEETKDTEKQCCRPT